ncbi:MAG: hypothetical protein WCH99_09925 [Verrucomicrobiota bacterium]
MKNISVKEAGDLGPAMVNPAHHAETMKAKAAQTTKTTLLDAEETQLLQDCEQDISQNMQGWCVLGFRLWQIRDRRLYRTPENRSFENYLAERWDYSKAHANRLIKAHLCVSHLQGVEDVDVYVPTKEAEVRLISNLQPEKQVQVAQEVKAMVGIKRATAEDFSEAREKLFPAPKKPAKPAEPTADQKPSVLPAEVPNASIPQSAIGSNLVPFADLLKFATQTYDDYNSGIDQKVRAGLRALKTELKKWAEAQSKQLNAKEAL